MRYVDAWDLFAGVPNLLLAQYLIYYTTKASPAAPMYMYM
jgi:hypothetical protein